MKAVVFEKFGAPPTGWCAHGSEACEKAGGEHARVMEMLIEAGAFVGPDTKGSAEVMDMLRKHRVLPRPE